MRIFFIEGNQYVAGVSGKSSFEKMKNDFDDFLIFLEPVNIPTHP